MSGAVGGGPPTLGGLAPGFPAPRGPGADRRPHLVSRSLLIALIAGLALLTAALVIVAVVEQPGPPPTCPPLGCQGPPVKHLPAPQSAVPVQDSAGRLYTSPSGFSVREFPLGTNFYPPMSATSDSVTFTYPFKAQYGGTSQLSIIGRRGGSATPQAVAAAEVNELAPNSTLDYVLPGAFVGYVPGFGEVVKTQVVSSSGTTATYELIVLAAVHRGFSIIVVAVGTLLSDVGPKSIFYNGHPTPAAINIAYVSDPTINSIQFPK